MSSSMLTLSPLCFISHSMRRSLMSGIRSPPASASCTHQQTQTDIQTDTNRHTQRQKKTYTDTPQPLRLCGLLGGLPLSHTDTEGHMDTHRHTQTNLIHGLPCKFQNTVPYYQHVLRPLAPLKDSLSYFLFLQEQLKRQKKILKRACPAS